LTKFTEARAGDKPAEIIYREIRIVEPTPELVQDLKNRKPITGLGHDKIVDKGLEHDKPLGDKFKDKSQEIRPDEHFGDKFGGGKPMHDLDHDVSDKKHGEVPKHDKDAYVGKKPVDSFPEGHTLKDGDYVGDKHLAYPAEEPRLVGVGDKRVVVDQLTELKEERHIGDKYHSDKGRDLGQNLGQAYDDGAVLKYTEKPLSPRHVDDGDKHLLGKKHGDKHDGDKHLFKKHDDGDKHLGKKHDHDKHKLTDEDGHKHKKHHDKVVTDKDVVADEPLPGMPDKHKIRDGDIVSDGEKVKDKYELKEADHIGDKYVSKGGWDLGQNLGKKYDDEDSYKLTDGVQYIPAKGKVVEVPLRPGETVTTVPAHERVPPAPPVAAPSPAVAPDERIAVPSAHGERVYGHELAREDDVVGDEHHRKHKKPGVIKKAIEKVKEKFSSNKSADTTPDPAADKAHHWEKVPDERSADDVAHWKDRGVEKGDKNKSKETY